MDYTTLEAESKASQEQTTKGMQSLYEVCQHVEDGREARGKRYELAGLLVVLILAKLAGMQNLLAASDWIADQAAFLREGLQLSWKRMPCANTYSYAASPPGQSTGECRTGSLVRPQRGEIGRCGQEPSRLTAQPSERHVHLAVDGKALKGTGTQLYGGEDPQKQVLHVYEVHTGIVLQQCPIALEHNAREYAQALADRSAVQRAHSDQRCS